MAESTIKIQLEHDLKELTGALGQVKTDKFQQERIAKHTKGAELSLQAGDLQTFRKNFNQLMGIFKDAAAVTGNLSQRVTELTKRQTELSKKIDETQGKLSAEKAKIGVSKKGEKGLTKDYANTFLKNQEASKKILDINDSLIDNYGNLVSKMKELNKEFPDIRRVTNEGAQRFGFKNIASVRAANQVVKAVPKEISGIEKNIADYEQEISQSQEEYKAVSTELEKVNNASQEAAGSLNKLYASINKLGNDTNSAISKELHKETGSSEVITSQAIPELSTDKGPSTSIGRAVKQFTLYHLALRSIKQAAREAVQTVKELDKSLTEQAMVTGKTREQTYQLLKGYQELAGQLGATTKDVAAVATEYMKQGKTTKEAMVLTEAAISAAKVAGISAADSVNYLTTALNGFRLEAEQAMKVSDKFAAIAAASATDYNELAIALSKVASQANLAGMSIDYTTALLAKGLETTREAPETMGTALKTIIARMRELGDYGETLEGDMDLNNVESQLAYVGIALRDQQGDLRSTEEVLDELGRKWETLSTNQQAAIAKALAGTRQQSRLIAMMEDYDRVIELQDISARSAGATAAQAAVYLEGMEGALNKINVAWEKIVTAVTDSEMIIQLMGYVSDGLTVIGEFLETTEGQIVLFGSIAAIAASILTTKIAENELEKTKNRLMLENAKQEQKEVTAEKQKTKIKKQQVLIEKNQELSKLKQLKTTQQETLTQLKANNENGKNTAKITALEAELAQTEKSIIAAKEEVKTAQIEYNSAQKEFIDAKTEEMNISNQLLQNQAGLTGQIYQMISPILTVISLFRMISSLVATTNTALATSGTIIDANNAKSAKGLAVKAKAAIAAIIGQIGIPGLVIGAALAAAFGIGFAVNQYHKEKEYSSAEKTAERVEALAVEIYKLEQKSNTIRKVSSSFEDLDNNIIKTKEDIEEMNSLLDQAADSLDEDQKAVYNAATSRAEKIALLEKFQQEADREIRAKQQEALNEVTNSRERDKLLDTGTTDTKTLTTQTLIKNINKTNLYDILDNSNIKAKESIEEFTSTILGAISPAEAYSLAMNQTSYSVEDLAVALGSLSISAKGVDGVLEDTNITEVLTSMDYSLEERIKAYEIALETLQSIDADVANAFIETYKDLETIKDNLYNNIQFIDSQKMSYDSITDISDAIIDLGYSANDAYEKLSELFTSLEDNFDVELAITTTLGIDQNSDEYKKILSNLESAFGIGLLNIGQQADKLKNKVNSVYETVSK